MGMLLTENLKNGMILERDLVNDLGITVLSKDTILNDAHINNISRMRFDFVFVTDAQPKPPEKIQQVKKDFSAIYIDTIETYKNIYLGILNNESFDFTSLFEKVENLIIFASKSNDIQHSFRKIHVDSLYEYRHPVNVAIYAALLGKWQGLSRKNVMELANAGILHDLGKTQVPVEVLKKSEKLSFDELEEARKHVSYSYDIAKKNARVSQAVLRGILEHHERQNGLGYPNGRKDSEISLYAKIIAIADSFDAMTSDKVYSKRLNDYQAIEEIKRNSFDTLDSGLSGIFVKKITEFFVGNKVELNDGRVGTVVLLNGTNILHPLVRVTDEEFIDLSTNPVVYIKNVL